MKPTNENKRNRPWRQQQALDVLADGKPYTCQDLAKVVGTTADNARGALFALYKAGHLNRQMVKGVCVYTMTDANADRIELIKARVNDKKPASPVSAYLMGEGQTVFGRYLRGAL